MSEILINLKYKEKAVSYYLNDNTTWSQFKEMLYSEFNINESKQIIMYQSKVIDSLDIIRKNGGEDIIITIKKKTKHHCSLNCCNNKVVKVLGDCRWCNLSFCSEHRLPETHHCPNYEDCRKNSFNKNAKLVGEMKCVSSKV